MLLDPVAGLPGIELVRDGRCTPPYMWDASALCGVHRLGLGDAVCCAQHLDWRRIGGVGTRFHVGDVVCVVLANQSSESRLTRHRSSAGVPIAPGREEFLGDAPS